MVVEKLKHPLTGLAVALGTLGQFGFGWFEPAWALVSSTATYWFPALATSGSAAAVRNLRRFTPNHETDSQ